MRISSGTLEREVKGEGPSGSWMPCVLGGVVWALVLAGPLLVLVPPGEAPDEPAHLAYVNHLLSVGDLPVIEPAYSSPTYEAWQPPFAYLAMAAPLSWLGMERVDYPFVRDPAFAFQRYARAYLVAPTSGGLAAARSAFRWARAANLVWLGLAVAAIFVTCLQLTRSVWVAWAAGVPFALAPQLLFSGVVVGNDAAAIALCAIATACLVRTARSPGVAVGLAASVFAGLGLWAKSSAAIMAPALALVLVRVLREGRLRVALSLLLPGLGLSVAWVLLALDRTGVILPSPPTGWSGGSGVGRLLTEPWWMISAWVSFWAKLGWFNVPLPALAYIAFLVPSALSAVGGIRSFLYRSANPVGLMLTLIVLSNLLLFAVYMVQIDWQPQGRYLLPAGAALAGLATLALDHLVGGLPPRHLAYMGVASGVIASSAVFAMLAILTAIY